MGRRSCLAAGVALLVVVVSTGCSLAGEVFGTEDLDNPTGRCVLLNRAYDRAVLTPVAPLDGTADDVVDDAPTLPATRVSAEDLDALAAGPSTRAGAEAYALGWATHALDSRDLGDLQPLLQRHGPRLPEQQVEGLTKSHCDAWVSAGKRRLDHDRAVWVRSDATGDDQQVQVDLAGTVTWRSHPQPVQDLSMRIDVEHGEAGWQLVAVQGPRTVSTAYPLEPRVGPPPGDGWRRATR